MRQTTIALDASDEARLRLLADQTIRSVRSLTIFALQYAEREIAAAPAETIGELSRLAKRKVGERAQINFAVPQMMDTLLVEIQEQIEDASGFHFPPTALVRASCALWLKRRTNGQLVHDLGEPYRRNEVGETYQRTA